ncbi:MAG TPA: hypothetical protein VIH57_25725 [Bacteroidales bacterium]
MTLAASKIEQNDKTLIMLTFPCPKEIIGNIWEITNTGWLFTMQSSWQGSCLCYSHRFSGYKRRKIKEKIRLEKINFAAQKAGGRWFVTHHTLQTVVV